MPDMGKTLACVDDANNPWLVHTQP